jgi:hypothetical protein
LSDVDSFLAPYDDIAVEVVDSTLPNTDVGLTYSSRELAENICQTMGWESFDLFESHAFEKVAARAESSECLSYAFIAFLRWRVFTTAQERKIGAPDFNAKVAAHSEFWYIKLLDVWNKQNPGSEQMRPWVH